MVIFFVLFDLISNATLSLCLEGSMKKYVHREQKNFASSRTTLTQEKRYVNGSKATGEL